MARYADIDTILNELPDDLPYKASVKRVLMQAPEADLVPKSEVERLVDKWIGEENLTQDKKTLRLIEALRDEAKRYERYYFNHEYDKLIAEAKAEVAREIFDEIEDILKIVKIPTVNADGYITPLQVGYWAIDPNDYAVLKKKYTEEKE